MSMDRCTDCDRLVDTDHDVECYWDDLLVEDGYSKWEGCVCEGCREDYQVGNLDLEDQLDVLLNIPKAKP